MALTNFRPKVINVVSTAISNRRVIHESLNFRRRFVLMTRGSSSRSTLPMLSMTLRLLFLFGFSGLLVLEGCGGGGGDKSAAPAAAADPAKSEPGCDPAVTGCCITKANGGCAEGSRCKGSSKKNMVYQCAIGSTASTLKNPNGCSLEECEALCSSDSGFPTADGGEKCIVYDYAESHTNSKGTYEKMCRTYSSCEKREEEKQGYKSYIRTPAGGGGAGTTAAP